MVTLDLELSQEGCSRLYDALVCLAKINETLTLEARPDQLNLSVLNSTKSAYVAFALDSKTFFSSFRFVPDERRRSDRFAFQILNKALSSVFKGKVNVAQNSEAGLERCLISIQDKKDSTVCRLVVQMIHRNGVTKTHKFTYEAVEAMHALFDSTRATNKWRIHARMLREYIEFFGARTEQLDMFLEDDRFTFTSYTEKIVHNKEVLKAPLQTSISLSPLDFPLISITDSLHIAIAVSDFKTMVLHATTLNTLVSCAYSVPSRPLQFSYTTTGMRCEFTLTTIGSAGGAATSAALAKEVGATRTRQQVETPASVSRQGSVFAQQSERGSLPPPRSSQIDMPPPNSVPASRLNASRGGRLGSNQSVPAQSQRSAVVNAQQDDESLFWPDNEPDNEDRRWGTREDRQEDDALGWATGAQGEDEFAPRGTFRDINSAARPSASRRREFDETGESFIAPTQRAADVRGLFDD